MAAAGAPLREGFRKSFRVVAADRTAPETKDCMVRQWARYALGRRELPTEDPSFDVLKKSFEASGYKLQTLLVEIAASDAFRVGLHPQGAP